MKRILSGLQYDTIEKIENYIIENNLKESDQLPSERDLCMLFQVSRQTLREAVKKLCDQNRLKSYQGKGTFIAQSPFHISFSKFSIFRLNAQNSPYTFGIRCLQSGKVNPDTEIITALSLDGIEKLWKDINVLQLDQKTVAIEYTYSLKQLHNELNDDQLYYKRKKFSLSEATKEEALLLGVMPNSIVFVEVSCMYRDNTILQYTKTIINAAIVTLDMIDYSH